MTIKEMAHAMKLDSFKLAATDTDTRNKALAAIAKALEEKKTEIFEANKKDLETAEAEGCAPALFKRLKFDEHKLSDVVKGINDLISLPDPLGATQFKRELDEGLTLVRESCPIGVIGVIFESRPDALVQIACLCVKSGNCAILKGGSEAMNSNRVLFDVLHEAVVSVGLPENCLALAQARSEISELLECHEDVDLVIPRGSNSFVQYIMNNTKIPVMGHADGICHIYVDKAADVDKIIPVIVDAKTQYTAVCNATETLLVHKDIAPALLPKLAEALGAKNCEIRGDEAVMKLIDCKPATDEDWATEYLDLIISFKIVDSIEEAIFHINKYGSHHTDAIMTEDGAACEIFMKNVDSAGVYHNCSTRFADGYRYGFGAEVGISTGKLHARGPVGLEGLCTYKYRLYGDGHIVAPYADGTKQFNFKNL